MEKRLYSIEKVLKANNRGWGKRHIVPPGSKVALCSAKMRRPVPGMFAKPIELVLHLLNREDSRTRHKTSCQNCLRQAEKLRNPLDRLASI